MLGRSEERVDESEQLLLGLGWHALDEFEPALQSRADSGGGGLAAPGAHTQQFVGGVDFHAAWTQYFQRKKTGQRST